MKEIALVVLKTVLARLSKPLAIAVTAFLTGLAALIVFVVPMFPAIAGLAWVVTATEVAKWVLFVGFSANGAQTAVVAKQANMVLPPEAALRVDPPTLPGL